MIIDVNTRIWSSPEQLGRETSDALRRMELETEDRIDAGLDAHERSMQCVNVAFVQGFTSGLLGASVPDEYIAEYCRRRPGRVGVASIDPMQPGALERLDKATELGLQAVAVSPSGQGFHPAHSRAMEIYERAIELGIPVIVAKPWPVTRSSQMEFGRPALWDEVARTFPNMPLLIGQLGYPWIDETLLLLAKHERVFADISGVVSRPWQLYNALLTARSLGVMSRLLFGSGFPFETPTHAIETLYSLNTFSQGTPLPAVPRTLVNGIVERDVFTCLGMEPAAAGAAAGTSAKGSGGEPSGRPMPARSDARAARKGGGSTGTGEADG